MKRVFIIPTKVAVLLIILSIFTSGCTLFDDIAAALGRLCAAPVFVVTTTADTADGLCTSDDCSLREAVQMSNSCAGIQTISIPAGTYALTRLGAGEDAASTGDLDITDSVQILGAGSPTVDGNRTDRVFDVLAGTTVDMTGFTIRHGQSDDGGGIRSHGILRLHRMTLQENVVTSPADPPAPGPTGGGGAILSERDGTLLLEESVVIGNSAYQGGGIAAYPNATTSLPRSLVDIRDTVIAENSAASAGGGLFLYVSITVTLTNVVIRDNTAVSDRGNGIWNGALLNLDYVHIYGNRGGIYGGGIYNYFAGHLTAYHSLIENNLSRFGGGVYSEGDATFVQSAIVHNRVERGLGGGLFNAGTDAFLSVINSTVSGNWGDGIINTGSLLMGFSTVAYNTGVGVSSWFPSTVHNSILAGNAGGDCDGGIVLERFNIESTDTCGFNETGDLVNTDPLLMPLAMNGGPTPTYALGVASPAIDSADPELCDSAAADQRGVDRPQGPQCDRGAYEFEGAPTPRATSTPTRAAAIPPTLAPSLTPTSTGASAGLSFLLPKFSTDHFYYYSAACGPEQVTLQIGVSDPAQVFSMGLFVRSVEKSSNTPSAWSGGFAMIPAGGGFYSFTLLSEDVPGYNAFAEAWLQYQFVANDKDGNPILRSAVFGDITLSRCDKK